MLGEQSSSSAVVKPPESNASTLSSAESNLPNKSVSFVSTYLQFVAHFDESEQRWAIN